MIRLVIFDFDDTLTDNRFLDYRAFLIPCKKLGLPIPPLHRVTNLRKKGYLAKDIMMIYLKQHKKEQLIQQFLDKRSKFLNSKKSLNYLKIKENTKSILYFLKRKKISCVLCTARKNKKYVLNFLAKNEILSYFSNVYFMEDLKFSIDNLDASNRVLIKNILVRKIIKNEKLKPTEMIFIGNSVDDIVTSKNMKIPFIYYQNSYLDQNTSKKIIKVKSMKNLQNKLNRYIKKEVKNLSNER